MRADHLFSDPPYSPHVHENVRRGGDVYSRPVDLGFRPLDDDTPGRMLASSRVDGWILAFCCLEDLGAWKAAALEAGARWIRGGVWVKPNAAPQFSGDRPAAGADGLAILHAGQSLGWNGGGRHAVWTCNTARVPRHWQRHPCEKPIGLWVQLLEEFTKPGDRIVDPFAGAASLGFACILTGRNYLGFERQKRWYQEAYRRLRGVLPPTVIPVTL